MLGHEKKKKEISFYEKEEQKTAKKNYIYFFGQFCTCAIPRICPWIGTIIAFVIMIIVMIIIIIIIITVMQ